MTKSSNDIGRELAEKGFAELGFKMVGGKLVKDPNFKPKQPQQLSRTWKDPEGYKYLVPWSNGILLRFLVRKFTDSLPRKEYRSKAQADDAARSMVRNIEEGYKRATTTPYLEFIGFSQGSLEELKGDVRDWAQDGFLQSKPDSSLAGLGIDLGDFHRALMSSRHPLTSSKSPLKEPKGRLKDVRGNWEFRPLTALYPPLAHVRSEDLTYEIFMELINKTDWLLRKLVESLERKLASGQKFYQVEQARIRGRIKGV